MCGSAVGAARGSQASCEGRAALSRLSGIPAIVASVSGFAIVSGLGLAMDVGLFLALSSHGVPPGYANVLSATVAIVFVYFAATRHVFNYQGRFLFGLLLAYLAYQALAVPAASLAVEALFRAGMAPLVAKVAILPVTFTANYLFMQLLTRAKA